MTRPLSWKRWIGVVMAGGTLFASGCLPANFYSQLLASSITTAVNTLVAGIATNIVPVK